MLQINRIAKAVVGAGVALTCASTANIAAIPANDPLARLAGRWSGEAVMTSMSGNPSSFKCVVTYLPARDGSGMKQNLRCKGEDIRLEASTLLQVDGRKVTGQWEDKINSLAGDVLGEVTEDGFDVMLGGAFFSARMAVVAGSQCAQEVTVSPHRSSYFRQLQASLRKC